MSGPYTQSMLDRFHCRQMGDFFMASGCGNAKKTRRRSRATLTGPRKRLRAFLLARNGMPIPPRDAMMHSSVRYPVSVSALHELCVLDGLWPTLWQDDEGRIGLG